MTTALDGADAGPNPLRFLAATVHVYVLAAVRATTRIDEWRRACERVVPPSLDVHFALYSMIGAPPLLAAAENATVTLRFPATADVIVGAPGTVTIGGASVTNGADAGDGTPKPTRFPASTSQVYVFDAVSRTRIGEFRCVFVRLAPPSLDVHETRYWRIFAPPSEAGAETVTDTPATPGVAAVIVGAPGTVGRGAPAAITTGADCGDGAPKPARLRASTSHVYVFAAVRPFTRIGDAWAICDRLAPPSLDVHATR